MSVYCPDFPSFFISENNLKLLRMTERSEKTSQNCLNDCLFLDPMMLAVLLSLHLLKNQKGNISR